MYKVMKDWGLPEESQWGPSLSSEQDARSALAEATRMKELKTHHFYVIDQAGKPIAGPYTFDRKAPKVNP